MKCVLALGISCQQRARLSSDTLDNVTCVTLKTQHFFSLGRNGSRGARGVVNLLGPGQCGETWGPESRSVLKMLIRWHPLGLPRREKALEWAGRVSGERRGVEQKGVHSIAISEQLVSGFTRNGQGAATQGRAVGRPDSTWVPTM